MERSDIALLVELKIILSHIRNNHNLLNVDISDETTINNIHNALFSGAHNRAWLKYRIDREWDDDRRSQTSG